MLLLPYETVNYRTSLSKGEALNRLHAAIDTDKIWSLSFWKNCDDKDYSGDIDNDGFIITRRILGRNSFRPVIFGDIKEDGGGTIVSVIMRPHLMVIIVLFIFCFVIGGAMIGALSSHTGNPASLMGLILFVYILMMVAFTYEKLRSTKDLERILDAEII